MATKTLNTRILLCNGTTVEWISSTKVLLSGEMAIEFTGSVPKFKFGNGVDIYSKLPYATMTPAEINTAITNAINTAMHTHTNKSILDGTTASYTTAEKNKLSNVEDNAKNTVIEIVRW